MTITGGGQRSPLARFAVLAILLLVIAALTGLGIWQLERRVWKLGLIARVDARVHAVPVAPPGPADWPKISVERDEYLRVRIAGHFLNDRETDVQALTALGPGFWVLTPLKTAKAPLSLSIAASFHLNGVRLRHMARSMAKPQ